MDIFYLIGLIFITVVSLIFSLLGFMGKDMILDDAYIKASEEEREKMDKKAYRLQGAIIFLFIFALGLILAAHFLQFDYGVYGVLMVLAFFLFQKYECVKKFVIHFSFFLLLFIIIE